MRAYPNNFNTDLKKAVYMFNYMDVEVPKVANWIQTIDRDIIEVTNGISTARGRSFNEIETSFKETFITIDFKQRALTKLVTMTQGTGDFHDFATQFLLAFHQTKSMTPQELPSFNKL
jgi:recombinational DNA repair ATPase RecF